MDADLRLALEKEISKAIDAASGKSFVWGRDDCLLWIADIYRKVLGFDPAQSYRGKYVTAWGAYRLLGRRGVTGALHAAARRYGWVRIDPADAKTGDLGLLTTPEGPCGVIRDRNFWVGRIHEGFSVYPSEFIAGAWDVGCLPR